MQLALTERTIELGLQGHLWLVHHVHRYGVLDTQSVRYHHTGLGSSQGSDSSAHDVQSFSRPKFEQQSVEWQEEWSNQKFQQWWWTILARRTNECKRPGPHSSCAAKRPQPVGQTEQWTARQADQVQVQQHSRIVHLDVHLGHHLQFVLRARPVDVDHWQWEQGLGGQVFVCILSRCPHCLVLLAFAYGHRQVSTHTHTKNMIAFVAGELGGTWLIERTHTNSRISLFERIYSDRIELPRMEREKLIKSSRFYSWSLFQYDSPKIFLSQYWFS